MPDAGRVRTGDTGYCPQSGECASMLTDAKNCGSCGRACASNETCTTGLCVTNCPAGFCPRSGQCLDKNTSVTDCGTCGHACNTGDACAAGTCGHAPRARTRTTCRAWAA